jgi:hypothetical protein
VLSTQPTKHKNHIIEVEITKEIAKGYQLKVSILDLGLYLFGFRLTLHNENKGWWLQTPAIRLPNRYWHNVEFDQTMTLWQEIEAKCHEARQEYEGSTGNPTEEDMSDEAISKGLDEAIKSLEESSTPSE